MSEWVIPSLGVGTAGGDEGFAAVDALTALTILAITLAMALAAGRVAVRAVTKASEIRAADRLLVSLADVEPWKEDTRSGSDSGFRWRVETHRTDLDASAEVALCDRSVEAVRTSSGRAYRLHTARLCSVPNG